MKKDEWKNDPDFGYYDYNLLSRVNRNLRLSREHGRIEELKDHLLGVVKSNFGGVENARLYSQTYHGTKKPIEDYVREGKPLYTIWGTCGETERQNICLSTKQSRLKREQA